MFKDRICEVSRMGVEDDVRAADGANEAMIIIAQALDKLSTSVPASQNMDEEDMLAELAAKRLEKDKHVVTADIGTVTPSLTVHEEDEKQYIELPTVSDEQKEQRRKLGVYLKLDSSDWPVGKGVPRSPVLDAYIAGGPIWLYDYDREFVLALPYAIRRQMIEDVSATDVGTAKLMSADILKASFADSANAAWNIAGVVT